VSEQPSESVSVSIADGLATLTLDREHGNAINADMVDGLRRACRAVAADESVRGVLLTARGKLFSPGLDLQELVDYDREEMDHFMACFSAAMLALFVLPKPLVAAISGHALAGGCLMAATADRRILQNGAKVGLNAIRVGVPLPFGSALILREAVHNPRIEELALLGRNYVDDEAVAVGIAHELHEERGFEAYCRERLREFSARDPLAFATTKRYLRSGAAERIRAQDDALRPEFLDCWFSDPTRARLGAMVAELRAKSEEES
jgi:enoyl-CoA hydratase/carnithine racemase